MLQIESGQFAPPDHLSQRSQAIWQSLVPRRARSAERLTILQVALEALDRADSARQVIADEGLITKRLTTGAIGVHPMLKVEQDSQRQFAKIWSSLGLETSGLDSVPDGHWENKPGVGRPA